MSFVTLQNIVKQYGSYVASDDVSLEIPEGRIFGLLGPNGAGKSTLIRMITRIIYPDSGHIFFDGVPLNDKHTGQIGYMPEERGLYKKMKVGEHLVYLGRLKGLDKKTAEKNVAHWLEKFQIQNWYHKAIEELSKGMSQKVQFIATVLHDPRLLILDEPFSGLDPINAQLIEQEIHELKSKGRTIVFSTHRMEQVEEICDDIILVNKGRKILEGGVRELKQRFKEHKFKICYSGTDYLGPMESASTVASRPGEAILQLRDGFGSNDLLHEMLRSGASIQLFQEVLPSINDIFIRQVKLS